MAISKEQPLRPYVQELGDAVDSNIIVTSCAVHSFDTVAEMQAATYLTAGMTCHTNGFHSEGDGGAAFYNVGATGTANGMDVLELQVGLFATLVVTEPYITPEQLGAYGDGVADDSDNINRAIFTYKVVKGAGTYLCDSTINLVSGADVTLSEIISNASIAVSASEVTDTKLQASIQCNGCSIGIYCKDSEHIDISNTLLSGFTAIPDASVYGIYIFNSINITINGCVVDNVTVDENYPSSRTAVGIFISGEAGADYGGFYTGTTVEPIEPSSGITITGCKIYNGKVAIDVLASEHVTIDNNVLENQYTRAIYFANASNCCIISNNVISNFRASAVLLGYCTHDVIVIGNHISNTVDVYGGEAAINVITGIANCLISDNVIDAFTNFGIYMAIDAVGNTVQGNDIRNHYIAGICLESQWLPASSRPSNSVFVRPNYGNPDVGTSWAHKDTKNNVITQNVIHKGNTARSTAAISISQMGDTYKNTRNVFSNNVINYDTPESTDYAVFTVHSDVSLFVDNKFVNNTIYDFIAARIVLCSDGTRRPFNECSGNSIINNGYKSILATSEISIGICDYMMLSASDAVNVTDFIGAPNGTDLYVSISANVTVVYNATKIFTKTHTNIVGPTNSYIHFKRINGYWYEI